MLRSKNREISIFNMSALDLFASALGAFILIAVTLFPYFLKTNTDEYVRELWQRITQQELELEKTEAEKEELQSQVEQQLKEAAQVAAEKAQLERQLREAAQEAKANAERQLREAAQAAAEKAQVEKQLQEAVQAAKAKVDFQFPHLDMVIGLDITGSMEKSITGLKEEIGYFARVLSKLAPSFAIGIVAFGDREYERPFTEYKLREMKSSRGNLASLVRFINSLEPNIGMGSGEHGDEPEAFYGALMLAIQGTRWRRKAEKKIIVMITDQPAYREEMQESIRAARSFSGSGSGYGVSTVYVPSKISVPGAEDFLEEVAEAGRGQAVKGGNTMTANLLLSLLD